MNGPTEFHVTGTIREWSIINRLNQIDVPTLLITGRHDEATPASMQPFSDRIPHVRAVDFAESSHMPHLEEPELFDEVMLSFLAGFPLVEQR
jgi:L-proline amide hydrolase